jgi:hypothetical protein
MSGKGFKRDVVGDKITAGLPLSKGEMQRLSMGMGEAENPMEREETTGNARLQSVLFSISGDGILNSTAVPGNIS